MNESMRRMLVQLTFMLGQENSWFTGEAVGHSPNPPEAIMHFIQGEGAKNFAVWWESLSEEDKLRETTKAQEFFTEHKEHAEVERSLSVA